MRQLSSGTLCILGCGGFIGSHLVERLLRTTNLRITGIDRSSAKVAHLLADRKLIWVDLDIDDHAALAPHIERCDTVVSLAALCNPALYNTVPLEVIDSNFTRPLEVVKLCAAHGRRLIHFSTCEVYGKTVAAITGDEADALPFDEEATPLLLGPVGAQRWSYAAAKQLLERVIFAYGAERKLDYTIVRPFNFIGPHMDFIPGIDGTGLPRVIACFMDALLFNKPLKLVDGGRSRRTFTYIDDAVDAIVSIIDKKEASRGRIFNIGNPSNEVSIADLAALMVGLYQELLPEKADLEYPIVSVPADQFYGKGYDDSDRRVPDIGRARELLGWRPKTGLEDALRMTIMAYIDEYGAAGKLRRAL